MWPRWLCLAATLLAGIDASPDAIRPLVIGHRGTAYLPELTIASQSLAYAYGADIVEIDVCLSRDNQLIVIHGNRSTSERLTRPSDS